MTNAYPVLNESNIDAFNIAAVKAVVKLAKTKRSFTTDDIWAALPASATAGVEPRALGAIMTSAQDQGAIKATGRYKPSKRPECHRRPVRVWKSLLKA